jgi:ribosomal protein S18 acetylase RimI-like enzyme
VTPPDFVKSFWYASTELGRRAERTPWGMVASDDRYPLVWDANNAAVLEPAPDLTTEEIEASLLPALRQAGATHEHVEFWETSVESPALAACRRRGDLSDPDVVMVLDRRRLADLEPGRIQIDLVTRPEPSFWPWYRDSLREFGMKLSDDVLDQLVRRTREVFLRAGLRWFVGSIDGHPAGYASLLSLAGTGYLDNVVTMPGYRRRGVASAAVTAAVRASLDRGDANVFLLAEAGGEAQRLYERLGFTVAASVESFTRPLPVKDPS